MQCPGQPPQQGWMSAIPRFRSRRSAPVERCSEDKPGEVGRRKLSKHVGGANRMIHPLCWVVTPPLRMCELGPSDIWDQAQSTAIHPPNAHGHQHNEPPVLLACTIGCDLVRSVHLSPHWLAGGISSTGVNPRFPPTFSLIIVYQ